MTTIRPRRSALYIPGSNVRALEKAKTLTADSLILDLEDAVAPDAKEEARERVCAAVRDGGYGTREIAVRVNGITTDWGEADLKAVALCGANAICVTKVRSAADVAAIREGLDGSGAPPEMAIWAMIETPDGILNAREIAAAASGNRYPVTVLIMGTNDLAKETRALQTADRTPMLAWLSCCVLAARAYGIDILDGVYNNFRDEKGFVRECTQGRELGMDGKTLIHPGQIDAANRIFSPDGEEIDWARKIIAAFEQPENRDKGVIRLDGKMVELLHREIATRTIAIAEAISEAES